jgi:hypothetical protein
VRAVSTHSVLSPSSAHRRIRCVGSLAACKGVPNPNSSYAAEGTAYHWVASSALESGKDCADYAGMVVNVQKDGQVAVGKPDANTEFSFTINDDDAAMAQIYVDAIRRLPGEKMFEVRLDTSVVVGVPGQGGTGDAVTLDYEHKTIHVDDLKFGRGEIVDAEDNEQLLEYGAAALWMFDMLADWEYVRVGIHQPRAPGGHYSEKVYSVEQVRSWVTAIRPAEQLAYKLYESGTREEIAAALRPSKKACRWCPIAGSCAARTKQLLNEFPIAKVEEPSEAAIAMSEADLAAALDRAEDLESWIKAIRSEAFTRAQGGATIPGWVLAEGRAGNRKWTDEAVVEASLLLSMGDAAFKPRVVVSPTDAEKFFTRKKGVDDAVRAEREEQWAELQPFVGRAEASVSLQRANRVSVPATPKKMEFPEVQI